MVNDARRSGYRVDSDSHHSLGTVKVWRREADLYYVQRDGVVVEFFDQLPPMLFTSRYMTPELRKSLMESEQVPLEECPEWVRDGVRDLQEVLR